MSRINKFKLKKAVSPLIATILLIAFAVALSSVVLNWGLNIGFGEPVDKCRNIEVNIRNVNAAEVCVGRYGESGYINFIIDNTGSLDINGLAVWIVGEKETRLIDLNDTLKKGALYEKRDKDIIYDASATGNIKQVQFIPKIKSEGITEICPKYALKVNKIGLCN